jgi:multisubunit Na+/H+ antiporter MnhF subunit
MSRHYFDGLLFGAELLFVPSALALYVLVAGDVVRRLIALQLFGTLSAAQVVLFSIAFANDEFADLGVAMALLAIGALFAYARFLERWL